MTARDNEMTPREKWKAAKAELDAVEAERDAATAHLQDRWWAAIEAEELARDAMPERIADCESCGEPIFDGDPHQRDFEYCIYTCGECSPTWQDLADHPEHFVDPDGEPHTAESVKAAVEAHLAGGGSLSDSMAVA